MSRRLRRSRRRCKYPSLRLRRRKKKNALPQGSGLFESLLPTHGRTSSLTSIVIEFAPLSCLFAREKLPSVIVGNRPGVTFAKGAFHSSRCATAGAVGAEPEDVGHVVGGAAGHQGDCARAPAPDVRHDESRADGTGRLQRAGAGELTAGRASH
eukprot:scaffold7723_cov100-Isochrysis_galbana.AAC.2